MAETLVASGGVTNFSSIGGYEHRFAEGDNGRLEVGLRTGLPSSVLSGIDTSIRKAGVTLTEPSKMVGNALHVTFRKGIAPLVIIAAAVAVAIVLVALVVTWKLMKLSPTQVIGTATVWLAVVAVAVIGVLMLVNKTKGG